MFSLIIKTILFLALLLVGIFAIGDNQFTTTLGYVFIVSVLVIAQALTVFFTMYQAMISLIGVIVSLFKGKDHSIRHMLHKRFALVVCAHNEEIVVGEIVDNLVKDMDYPRDMYDVYVICDNCTDGTATIVRERGGIAMERFDSLNKGKGFALEWMFNKLWEMESEGNYYDALCIFDADNLSTPNFLQEMNAKIMAGCEVMQGYLDSKNPADSWVSKSYAGAYWATNSIYQNIRNGLGLSAQLGGTGMCFTTDILKEIGWGTESLTEDLEFTAKYVMLKDKPVAWVHNAKVYDEKPVKFKPTWKQRIRWMIGHTNCCLTQCWPILQMAIKKRSLLHLDIALYLLQPVRVAVISSLFITIVMTLCGWMPDSINKYLLHSWLWGAGICLSYLMPVVGLVLEKRKFREFSYLLWSYWFSFSWVPITFLGYVRRNQREWNPTKHTRVLNIDNMKADA